MVTAIVAGMLLSGGVQAQAIEYRPTKNQPFAFASLLAELMEAKTFKPGQDWGTFTWEGSKGTVTLSEADGIVKVSGLPAGSNVTDWFSVLDIPTEKCRMKVTVKRDGQEDQTIEANVATGAAISINGGLGYSSLTVRARRNADATFTLACQINRVLAESPTEIASKYNLMVRVKEGEPIAFGSGRQDTPSGAPGKDGVTTYATGVEPGVRFLVEVDSAKP